MWKEELLCIQRPSPLHLLLQWHANVPAPTWEILLVTIICFKEWQVLKYTEIKTKFLFFPFLTENSSLNAQIYQICCKQKLKNEDILPRNLLTFYYDKQLAITLPHHVILLFNKTCGFPIYDTATTTPGRGFLIHQVPRALQSAAGARKACFEHYHTNSRGTQAMWKAIW